MSNDKKPDLGGAVFWAIVLLVLPLLPLLIVDLHKSYITKEWPPKTYKY